MGRAKTWTQRPRAHPGRPPRAQILSRTFLGLPTFYVPKRLASRRLAAGSKAPGETRVGGRPGVLPTKTAAQSSGNTASGARQSCPTSLPRMLFPSTRTQTGALSEKKRAKAHSGSVFFTTSARGSLGHPFTIWATLRDPRARAPIFLLYK